MKANRRLKSFRLAAIVLAASFLFVSTSCDKGPNENSPELPPLESLMMSFSDFDAPRADAKASGEPHLNFNYAFTSLVFWSGASAITMALPVAAYGYASSFRPYKVRREISRISTCPFRYCPSSGSA